MPAPASTSANISTSLSNAEPNNSAYLQAQPPDVSQQRVPDEQQSLSLEGWQHIPDLRKYQMCDHISSQTFGGTIGQLFSKVSIGSTDHTFVDEPNFVIH